MSASSKKVPPATLKIMREKIKKFVTNPIPTNPQFDAYDGTQLATLEKLQKIALNTKAQVTPNKIQPSPYWTSLDPLTNDPLTAPISYELCSHQSLRFCPTCGDSFCEGCGQEWYVTDYGGRLRQKKLEGLEKDKEDLLQRIRVADATNTPLLRLSELHTRYKKIVSDIDQVRRNPSSLCEHRVIADEITEHFCEMTSYQDINEQSLSRAINHSYKLF